MTVHNRFAPINALNEFGSLTVALLRKHKFEVFPNLNGTTWILDKVRVFKTILKGQRFVQRLLVLEQEGGQPFLFLEADVLEDGFSVSLALGAPEILAFVNDWGFAAVFIFGFDYVELDFLVLTIIVVKA
jgi:hypothetical protein